MDLYSPTDFLRIVLRAVLEPMTGAYNSSSFPAMSSVPSLSSAVAATPQQIRENFPLALVLSVLAGASTGLGGLLMVSQSEMTTRRLGVWQGAAAGFMCSVSIFDLLPTVMAELAPGAALFYIAIGAATFLALQHFIPEPNLDAYLAVAAKTSAPPSPSLSPSSSSTTCTTSPSQELPRGLEKDPKLISRSVLWSGLVTALGISLHNFPEGIAVCVASLRGLRFGLPLAIAIALHNLPEGAAVALPVYFATLDKPYAVRLAFLSGMAEPLGVCFVGAAVVLFGIVLTKAVVAAMLAAVAGVMLIICAVELFPQARVHAGDQAAVLSTCAGLLCMTMLLWLIDFAELDV